MLTYKKCISFRSKTKGLYIQLREVFSHYNLDLNRNHSEGVSRTLLTLQMSYKRDKANVSDAEVLTDCLRKV